MNTPYKSVLFPRENERAVFSNQFISTLKCVYLEGENHRGESTRISCLSCKVDVSAQQICHSQKHQVPKQMKKKLVTLISPAAAAVPSLH
jgi:hypothetical protein